jgi:ABC-type antimicrobial peptide transport system permease subunit
LAATGTHAILSGSVAERTREIGIRSALGAARRGILGLILKQGMTLTVLGVTIGQWVSVSCSKFYRESQRGRRRGKLRYTQFWCGCLRL